MAQDPLINFRSDKAMTSEEKRMSPRELWSNKCSRVRFENFGPCNQATLLAVNARNLVRRGWAIYASPESGHNIKQNILWISRFSNTFHGQSSRFTDLGNSLPGNIFEVASY